MADNEGAHQIGEAINGLLRETIAEPLAKFRALPEGPQKNRKRASWGVGLLAAGIYVAKYKTRYFYPATPDLLVKSYLDDLNRPLASSWPSYAWGAVMLFGLLWVVVGLLGSRAPRDIMGAFWALVRIGVAGGALWYPAYLGDRSYDWWLQGLYITVLASSLMALLLCVRGTGPGAVRLIQEQIARQARTFRIGRRRSF